MVTGEGAFATRWSEDVRVEELPMRRFAARRHDGELDDVEATRRPLYQHLIMHEFVGGPPVLRFRDDGAVDVLVGAAGGFRGDEVAGLVVVPQGWFAVMDYDGPPRGLARARQHLRAWAVENGHTPAGHLLQVHLMDEIEGETQQQLQLPIEA
jgi:DNA gyrase inhibitor GyrI